MSDLAEQLASFVPPPQPDEADDGSGEGSSLGGGNGDLCEGGYVAEESLLDAMLGLPSTKHAASDLAGSNSNKNGSGSASGASRIGGMRRGSLASKQGNNTTATTTRRSPMPKVNFASASTLASSLSRAMDAQRQHYREKSNGSASSGGSGGGGSIGSPHSGGGAPSSSSSPLSPLSLDLSVDNTATSVGFAGGARATPEVAQLLSSVGGVSSSCARLVHVSEANWAAMEKLLGDAQERCRADIAALRDKVCERYGLENIRLIVRWGQGL